MEREEQASVLVVYFHGEVNSRALAMFTQTSIILSPRVREGAHVCGEWGGGVTRKVGREV